MRQPGENREPDPIDSMKLRHGICGEVQSYGKGTHKFGLMESQDYIIATEHRCYQKHEKVVCRVYEASIGLEIWSIFCYPLKSP